MAVLAIVTLSNSLISNPGAEGAIDLPGHQSFAILFPSQLEGQPMGQGAAGAAPGAGKEPCTRRLLPLGFWTGQTAACEVPLPGGLSGLGALTAA